MGKFHILSHRQKLVEIYKVKDIPVLGIPYITHFWKVKWFE